MIIALSGPSGIGKGYAKEAIKELYPNTKELLWYTTRALRPNEVNGISKNRAHIDIEDFEKQRNNFALIQEIFNNKYAVKKSDLLESEEVILTEIHPYVVGEAKNINPRIVTIGLITDDFDLLAERLAIRRKTESEDEIRERVKEAVKEVKAVKKNCALYDEIVTINRENEEKVKAIMQEIFEKYRRR